MSTRVDRPDTVKELLLGNFDLDQSDDSFTQIDTGAQRPVFRFRTSDKRQYVIKPAMDDIEVLVHQQISSDGFPSFIRILIDNDSQTKYLVTEFLDGYRELLPDVGAGAGDETVAPADLSWIFPSLLRAVQELHLMGFACNDISGSNVMIHSCRKRVRLVDLGSISKLEEPSPSSTPGYMPQSLRNAPGRKRDIYGCAAVIARTMLGMPATIRTHDTPVELLNDPTIPPRYKPVLTKSLEGDYENIESILRDIQKPEGFPTRRKRTRCLVPALFSTALLVALISSVTAFILALDRRASDQVLPEMGMAKWHAPLSQETIAKIVAGAQPHKCLDAPSVPLVEHYELIEKLVAELRRHCDASKPTTRKGGKKAPEFKG